MLGFFVEAGAFDGATDSTSLHFEIAHKWSGLLVEPVSRFLIFFIFGHHLLSFDIKDKSKDTDKDK